MQEPQAARPAELTVKAVALGLFLALVFGAANAYLGMRAGQTVAATIPAAVIAMAIFRLPSFRGTILEQNIVRTAASAGEALVAGAIFTIPAFMLAEVDGQRVWSDLRAHYWEAVLILLCGGLIGVLFIIALRRPLCVDAGLPWPESVASVEIVKAGAQKSDAPRYIFGAMLFGGAIQILKSDKGLQVMAEYLDGFLAFPAAQIGPLNAQGGIPWSTPALSPALMGIGYIIGARLACINVAGGILAWWVLIPLLLMINPGLSLDSPNGPDLWKQVVRPVAVGAMLVAAANTLFGMRESIVQSLRGAFAASAAAGHAQAGTDPAEQDIPGKWVLLGMIGLLAPVTVIYFWFTASWKAAIISAIVMTVTGFLLSAAGGYLVGLVGSSNQPVSGLTLAALVISAFVLLAAGVGGRSGVAAVLGIASVVCCSCCVAGALIQDLKAGHLLGGSPWKMQVVEAVAVGILAFFLMVPIMVLHEANEGGIGGRALPAPQAGLMAQLANGIMSGQMAWGLLGIGAAFAFALLLTGARAPMLIAVGMYLPFDTTSAIFLGGILQWFTSRLTAGQGETGRARVEETGTLIASGLIAGEAIVGILLASTVVMGVPSFTQALFGVDRFEWLSAWGGWTSLAGFVAVSWVLAVLPARRSSGS
jgi:putative OPT family oligopeptide transporter